MIDEYIKKELRLKNRNTIKTYKYVIRLYLSYLKINNNPMQFEDYIESNYALSTQNLIKTIINNFNKRLNLDVNYKIRKDIRRNVQVISSEDMKKIDKALAQYDEEIKIIIDILKNTGVRISEIKTMKFISHETFDKYQVEGKGGKFRNVFYLSNEGAGIVKDYIERGWNKEISVRTIQRKIKYLSLITGVKFSAHTFRRTFVSEWANSNIFMVAELMGHNDLDTTRKYYYNIQSDLIKIKKEGK